MSKSFSLRSLSTFNMHRLGSMAQAVFLYQSWLMNIVIIAIGLVLVAITAFTIFFTTPAPEQLPVTPTSRSLNTTIIDELELWIEERQAGYATTFSSGRPNYFARPSIGP